MSLARRKDVWPAIPSLFGNVFPTEQLRAIEGYFGGGLSADRRPHALKMFTPSVEVRENAEEYIVKTDLPGVKLQDVKITLTANILRIEGHRVDETEDEKARFHVLERSYGSFVRTFTLPEGTDGESVAADMKDGVLTVTIPKRPEEQPRQIPIRSAGNSEQS